MARPVIGAAKDRQLVVRLSAGLRVRLERVRETLSKRAGGVDLVSLSENIDTTNAAGKMVFRMLAVLSEFERDLVVERTTMAMQHKRSRNERIGEVPFGYRVGADGTHLEADETEQGTLSQLRKLRARGFSVRRIADTLNGKGVPARSGRWHHNSVWRVLRRETEAAA